MGKDTRAGALSLQQEGNSVQESHPLSTDHSKTIEDANAWALKLQQERNAEMFRDRSCELEQERDFLQQQLSEMCIAAREHALALEGDRDRLQRRLADTEDVLERSLLPMQQSCSIFRQLAEV